jgi:hypothetical protein
MTCVGEIVIARRYWKCRCGADGGYASDRVLGVAERMTRRLQQKVCRLGADVSFAKAQENLKELLDLDVGAETLRTLCERHGQQMSRFQPKDQASAQQFRDAAGDVEFTIDAGKVNTREEGWKDLKIAVFQKRAAGKAVLPGQWPEQRLPEASARLMFADIQKSKLFRRQWPAWLKQLHVCPQEMHVLGDGADWIWRSVNRCFSGCPQTLDFFHACEHVSKAAAGWHGDGSEAAKAAYEQGRELLVTMGWSGVCAWVNEQIRPDSSAEAIAVRDNLLGYFQKHATRLNYAANLRAGRAIGSGVVEGQAKTLGLRLKARGARWRKCNARRMAALVSVRHSTQWKSYWSTAV